MSCVHLLAEGLPLRLYMRPKVDCIPDFEGAIRAARDNLATVLVKIDAEHVAIVGVGLLALELQCGCVGRQEVSV